MHRIVGGQDKTHWFAGLVAYDKSENVDGKGNQLFTDEQHNFVRGVVYSWLSNTKQPAHIIGVLTPRRFPDLLPEIS